MRSGTGSMAVRSCADSSVTEASKHVQPHQRNLVRQPCLEIESMIDVKSMLPNREKHHAHRGML